MSLSNAEVREALFRVFDGWAEQKAAWRAESATLQDQACALRDQSSAVQDQACALQDQSTAHIEQMQAHDVFLDTLTAQHEALRALVEKLDTEEEQDHPETNEQHGGR